MARLVRHLFCDYWSVARAFSKIALDRIEQTIATEERRHDGEIRFAVEASLPLRDYFARVDARDRAVELFSRMRVWDTERNTGVLIYLLLADRRVEIVADRGINAKVGGKAWEAICRDMQGAFREHRFEVGALAGIRAVSELLAANFPPQAGNPNELSDRPVILR